MALGVTVVSATAAPGQASIGQPAQLAQKGGGGWLRMRVATITGDAAYPSGPNGGYAVTASTFLLASQILGIVPLASLGVATTTDIAFDYVNNVIRFYNNLAATSASEAGSGTNLTTATWRILVVGI